MIFYKKNINDFLLRTTQDSACFIDTGEELQDCSPGKTIVRETKETKKKEDKLSKLAILIRLD
jgi:hypothetical protein